MNESKYYIHFFKVVLKNWRLFILAAIFGVFVALVYNYLQKPVYKSRLTFSFDQGETGISNLINLASEYRLNISGREDIFNGDNIIELLKSRNIVEKVLLSSDTFSGKNSLLIQVYLDQYNQSNRAQFLEEPHKTNVNDLSNDEKKLLFSVYNQIVQKNLVVDRPDRTAGIYAVNFTSLDERFSKIFTDRLIAYADTFYTACCTKKAQDAIDLLTVRYGDVKDSIHASMDTHASLEDINMNKSTAAASAPLHKVKENIRGLSGAYEELARDLELAKYQYLKKKPLLFIIDAPDYPLEKIKPSLFLLIFWFIYLSQAVIFLFLLFKELTKRI